MRLPYRMVYNKTGICYQIISASHLLKVLTCNVVLLWGVHV